MVRFVNNATMANSVHLHGSYSVCSYSLILHTNAL